MEKEEDIKCQNLRAKLLSEYKDTFWEKLRKEDVINDTDVQIEQTRSSKIKPTNCKTPADIPRHLRAAANRELQAALVAGILEE